MSSPQDIEKQASALVAKLMQALGRRDADAAQQAVWMILETGLATHAVDRLIFYSVKASPPWFPLLAEQVPVPDDTAEERHVRDGIRAMLAARRANDPEAFTRAHDEHLLPDGLPIDVLQGRVHLMFAMLGTIAVVMERQEAEAERAGVSIEGELNQYGILVPKAPKKRRLWGRK